MFVIRERLYAHPVYFENTSDATSGEVGSQDIDRLL